MHVTVLMPVYNGHDTITEAVASIQQQTYPDWDLVIVDDGSVDGSAELLRQMAAQDSRLTIAHNAKNRGLAASLNRGLGLARGELIARMDADDISLPDRLACQVAFMDSHPEVAVLGGGAELVNERGQFVRVIMPRESHEEMVRHMYKENPLFHPTIMARRSFFEAMEGYDERWRCGEDNDLWLRSYRRFRFHNLKKVLIRYHLSGGKLGKVAEEAAVLAVNAHREGRLLTRGWYALRYLLGAPVIMLGLVKSRWR